jgi:hypothetical protein
MGTWRHANGSITQAMKTFETEGCFIFPAPSPRNNDFFPSASNSKTSNPLTRPSQIQLHLLEYSSNQHEEEALTLKVPRLTSRLFKKSISIL